MGTITQPFSTGMRRVLIAQTVLLITVATVFFSTTGQGAALAAAYGGAITLFGSWWTARRVNQAAVLARQLQASAGALALYGGAVQRYIFVLAALAIGFGLLMLPPLPLLAGFAISQLGYMMPGRKE